MKSTPSVEKTKEPISSEDVHKNKMHIFGLLIYMCGQIKINEVGQIKKNVKIKIIKKTKHSCIKFFKKENMGSKRGVRLQEGQQYYILTLFLLSTFPLQRSCTIRFVEAKKTIKKKVLWSPSWT